MLNADDFQTIDLSYFDIMEATPFYLALRSKSTGHYWHLLEQDLTGSQTFYVSHKHHFQDSFHPQTCKRALEDCFQYIKGHDEYHLKRVRDKKAREKFKKRKCTMGKGR